MLHGPYVKIILLVLVIGCGARAGEADRASAATAPDVWCVLISGLPGDVEHETQFREIVRSWQQGLRACGVAPERLRTFGGTVPSKLPAGESEDKPRSLTADGLRQGLTDLATEIPADAALWVFVLGHGNYDGRQAWLHLNGRDPSADDLARWLEPFRARQQTVWLTNSASGWFVRPLSKSGRVVIAATAADEEYNETEFPAALATVLNGPAEALDSNQDQRISAWELFAAVTREVTARFAADERVPTENAQLDDNGDGRGTEAKDLASKAPGSTVVAPTERPTDGQFATQVFLPLELTPSTKPVLEAASPDKPNKPDDPEKPDNR